MSLDYYLSQLQLLRNDPAVPENIRPYAEKGNVNAQYAMGLIYAEGRGLPIDLARSHYWLSLAVAQGDTDADMLRNIVGCQMSEDEYQASLRMQKGAEMHLVGSD
ncbi:MAG: sel1 repeat family protein [Gammaproteobacteria bacterium]